MKFNQSKENGNMHGKDQTKDGYSKFAGTSSRWLDLPIWCQPANDCMPLPFWIPFPALSPVSLRHKRGRRDLNPRPADLQSAALPLCYILTCKVYCCSARHPMHHGSEGRRHHLGAGCKWSLLCSSQKLQPAWGARP